jgi:very-short-patch-repair endonuclease
MATITTQRLAWALARSQHWVVSRVQLLELGFTPGEIRHRLKTGRLHRLYQGVYAVGHRGLTRKGEWMAAVLACGPGAVLRHTTAAALWQIRSERERQIHLTVPLTAGPRHAGVTTHRSGTLRPNDRTDYDHIPVTTPLRTLIDLATILPPAELETTINEADKLDLLSAHELRAALVDRSSEPGIGPLRTLLDRSTFRLTRSELERRFLPLARCAGLPTPLTNTRVNSFLVDFYWPDLGLVVETDGLRYHRTPATQARDRLRDQAHTAAGLTQLRFTHNQVRYEPEHVRSVLTAVARRLAA